MIKKQHYMTHDERCKLETLYNDTKLPVSQIAKILGFCRQTIYNEIKLGTYVHNYGWYDKKRYSAEKAEQRHQYNQTAKGRPLKIGNDHAFAQFLEEKISKGRYSPAAALAAAKREGHTTRISITTLYSYIDRGLFLHLTNKDLWEKSKRKRRTRQPVRRIVHPQLPSISDRPQDINQRKEYGHWEMDLVVSKAGSQTALLTLTERMTRQELIFKLPNRKAATVRAVFDRLERTTPNFRQKFKSLTTDNGPEFLELAKLQRSIKGGIRFDIWYCHSYAAWEKGSNENHNRIIRRFFPKGTDFTKITKKRVAEIQDWMNNYPRKILDWYTPNELTA